MPVSTKNSFGKYFYSVTVFLISGLFCKYSIAVFVIEERKRKG